MIYAKVNEDGSVVDVYGSSHSPHSSTEYNAVILGEDRNLWQYRRNWESFERATEIAAGLTKLTGDLYLPIDNGTSTWPRYDVIEAPKVGDKVSYAFNGDYYPDGEITHITKTFQIKTSAGNTYRRRKNTGSWRQPGGTWSLVQGHINERNPSF